MAKLIKLLDNIGDFGTNSHILGEPRYGLINKPIYINIDSVYLIDVIDNENSNIFEFEGYPLNRKNIIKNNIYSLTRISIKDSNRILYTTEPVESFVTRINN